MRHLNLGCLSVSAACACGVAASAGSGGGLVVCWGDNASSQQCEVPAGLAGVVKVAAGSLHNMALKSDGTVVCWGWQFQGICDVPKGLAGVSAVAAGAIHSAALKADGTLVCWGEMPQSSVPTDLPPRYESRADPRPPTRQR
jgi:alpha-tubulin suppressor-like RCC1 family protein